MFIHSYHNAAHAITGISPSMLCFTTPTKTYLSSCIDDTPQPVADTMRKSQNEKYKCIKEIFFKKALQLTLNIGDNAIMKGGGLFRKNDYKPYPTLFKGIDAKYIMVTVKSGNGNNYTHHITFFKKVKQKGTHYR